MENMMTTCLYQVIEYFYYFTSDDHRCFYPVLFLARHKFNVCFLCDFRWRDHLCTSCLCAQCTALSTLLFWFWCGYEWMQCNSLFSFFSFHVHFCNIFPFLSSIFFFFRFVLFKLNGDMKNKPGEKKRREFSSLNRVLIAVTNYLTVSIIL